MTRVLLFVLTLAVLLAMPGAGAQEPAPLDVIIVSGPLDPTSVRFMEDTIAQVAEEGSQAAIIQLDSEGALTDEVADLLDLFKDPPLPLVVWVGEAPAVAYGGAAQLLAVAPLRTAAPGVEVGYLTPTVAGDRAGIEIIAGVSSFDLFDQTMMVDAPIPDLVDAVLPSIGQVVVWLDGREVSSGRGTATLATAEEVIGDDGIARMTPTVPVRFHEPGLITRALRLAIQPEAAFFFLVMGLTLAAFEFYAIGPGLAAATGVLSLLIGGYGLTVLPVRWWALVLIGGAFLLYILDFQRRSFGVRSILATVMLVAGGSFLADATPQITTSGWGVGFTVVLVLFFFMYAMPLTARSRFSTGTIGRRQLIGKTGSALTALGPDGIVEVDGAQWEARSHREAGIAPGDSVIVTAIQGLVLEVEPRKAK